MTETNNNEKNSKLIGLLAQFDDPETLVFACDAARRDGYKAMDGYSPFPVHGIDPAIGIKRTVLPFIVLGVALLGLCWGLGIQWYSNKIVQSPIFPGYPFKISGKPYFSLPANIPVTFEIIVLSSAFATFLGMWFLNRLPRLANPLHRVSRFKRVTNDKFFLMIETRDPKFDANTIRAQMNEWGAVAIEECRQDLTDTKLPSWLKMAGIFLVFALMLPPVMIFRAQSMVSREPRLHFMPDMDWQEKGKTQTISPILPDGDYVFADSRVMRQPVAGSIARGHLAADSALYRGIKPDWKPPAEAPVAEASSVSGSATPDSESEKPAAASTDLDKYVTEFPDQIEINAETIARGQQRFNIYCVVCHGYAGNGDGLVNERAIALSTNGKANWTAAKSLHDPDVMNLEKNPIGRIFETITHGRNTMGPYGAQIPVADRWLIVAYVKALQETGIKPAAAVAATDEE